MSKAIILSTNNSAEIKTETGYKILQKGTNAVITCDKAEFTDSTIIVPINSVIHVSNGMLYIQRQGYIQECPSFGVSQDN